MTLHPKIYFHDIILRIIDDFDSHFLNTDNILYLKKIQHSIAQNISSFSTSCSVLVRIFLNFDIQIHMCDLQSTSHQ